MKKSVVALVLLTIALNGTPVYADVLNAHPGPADNGLGTPAAIFFDLEALSGPMIVTGLTTANTGAPGAAFSVEVLTRSGTALGGPVASGPGSSLAGWTSLGTVPGTQGATTNQVSLLIDIPDISLAPGSVTGVALRWVTGGGARYFGTGTGAPTTYQDSNLRLVTGDARSAPFTPTGSFFTPRRLVGVIEYHAASLYGAGTATPSSVPQSCSTLLSVTAFPDPGGSTGIEVSGDLTAFGGSATQVFTETSPGSNVFTYNLVVPAEQPVGLTPIVATITDNELHTANININVTISPAFTIVAAADPTAVDAGEQVLLTVQVNIPACSTSSAHVVTGDLTPIGGSVPQSFFDDGPGGGHGDAVAGDGIYSFLATVAPATPDGAHLIPVAVVDAQDHEASAVIAVAVGGFFEIEVNDNKATATVVDCMSAGEFIQGSSTGTTITGTGALNSADYYRVKTCAAPLAIYRHRLQIESEVPGHASTIRALTQTNGVVNQNTDAVAQTAPTAATGDLPARTVQWYGFGKQEEIYYRVTGTATTTEPYTSTLTTTTVDPVLATQTFAAGDLTISRIAASTVDEDLWIYDSGFNAIECYGRDQPEPLTMTATFGAGTYYIVISNFNLANNQPSCPPEAALSDPVLDFADAVTNSSATLNLNVGLTITDGVTTEDIPLTKASAFDVKFVRFTVGGTGCACSGDMDGSTTRNGLDVTGFVAAVIEGASGCADINGDTAVNNADVGPFIILILNGTACP